MKTFKSFRRSISPFGVIAPPADVFSEISEKLESALPGMQIPEPVKLEVFADILALPGLMKDVSQAPSGESALLQKICDFIKSHHVEIEEKGLMDDIYRGMKEIFYAKTELFLVDHHDEKHCKEMNWDEKYRDYVLFSEERNILIAQFFEPITKDNPGRFSEFVSKWTESKSMDRILHFFDFCKGSKNPTFEHYLVFAHPAFSRALNNKDGLKKMLKFAHPLAQKLKSPTWHADIQRLFSL